MKRIYVDMDDVLCNFSKAHREATNKIPEIIYPQSQVDFFRKLEPIEGAVEGFKTLFGCSFFETYILTAPSIYNPMCYMEKRLWVEDHLGFEVLEKLIISPDKSLFIGDYLIDDRATGNGQDKFQGKHLHFGTEEFPDWESILDYLVCAVDIN